MNKKNVRQGTKIACTRTRLGKLKSDIKDELTVELKDDILNEIRKEFKKLDDSKKGKNKK